MKNQYVYLSIIRSATVVRLPRKPSYLSFKIMFVVLDTVPRSHRFLIAILKEFHSHNCPTEFWLQFLIIDASHYITHWGWPQLYLGLQFLKNSIRILQSYYDQLATRAELVAAAFLIYWRTWWGHHYSMGIICPSWLRYVRLRWLPKVGVDKSPCSRVCLVTYTLVIHTTYE